MASDLLEYAARHQSRDAAAAVAPVLFRAAPGGLHKAAGGFPGATGKPFGRDLDGFERGADFVEQMLEPEPRPLLSRRAEKFKRMSLFRRFLVHRLALTHRRTKRSMAWGAWRCHKGAVFLRQSTDSATGQR